MNVEVKSLFEILVYFISFTVTLYAFESIDFSKLFKKDRIWQIQTVYFMTCIIFAYLFTKAFMNIIQLTENILL